AFLCKIKIETTAYVIVESRDICLAALPEHKSGVADIILCFLIQRPYAGLFAIRNSVINEKVYLFMTVVKVRRAAIIYRMARDDFERRIESLIPFFLKY